MKFSRTVNPINKIVAFIANNHCRFCDTHYSHSCLRVIILHMQLSYEIKTNESLSHWLYTGIGKKGIEAPMSSFYAPVNMGEAYVQIVYPQRKWFLSGHDLGKIERYEGDYPNIYFPFEDSKVNFSTAIKTTTHIWTYLKSDITVPENGDYPFSIATCGGLKLWVDGKEALIHAPYDRNIPHSREFSLSLEAGSHTFEIYADELAERDVFFYFDFIYKGDAAIEQAVETSEDPLAIHQAESFLASLSMTRTTYCYGGIEAEFDTSMLDTPLVLSVRNVGEQELSFTITKGMTWLKLAEYFTTFFSGKAEFTVRIGNAAITRKILYSTAPRHLRELPLHQSIEERKAEAISFLCSYGNHLMPHAMVIMEKAGYVTDEARSYIEKSLDSIERREDCADFVLAPMIWSMKKYRDIYPEDLYSRMKEAVLSFRYWIDEKGNDAMWYFSENHAFLFHVSQYLAGNLFKDEIFTNSGRKGDEVMRTGRSRLVTWFRNFSLYHYAEWNSASYFPVDLIGLFSLYESAPEDDIREKAEDALDYTFTVIRDNTFHGIMSSSFGRAYEGNVKAKELNEPSFLSYIAFGDGKAVAHGGAAALFSLSSYIPPIEKDEEKEDELTTLLCVQGLEPVWTYRASCRDYSISSALSFKPFRHGHQQHIMDVMLGREATLFVNHPGEKAYSGENRPSYWAGNGTLPLALQYKALLVLLFDIEEKEVVKYIHAYFPTWFYDEWSIDGHYAFARSGNGYAGLYFSSVPHLTTVGMNRMREIIAEGEKQLVIVRCSNSAETGSFDNFRKLFTEAHAEYKDNTVSFRDFSYGLVKAGSGIQTEVNGKVITWEDSALYQRNKEPMEKPCTAN